MGPRTFHKRWLAAVTSLLALACAEPAERSAHHFQLGQEAVERGDTRAALLEFQSALNYQPGDAALYEKIGDTLSDHEQSYRESLKYYNEAMRLEPDRIHSQMRAARLVAAENLPRARSLVNLARLKHRNQAIVHRTDAHVKILEKELDQALFAARRATRLDETSSDNWAQLGAVHLAKIEARINRGERPSALLFSLAIGAFDKVNETEGGKYPLALLEKGRVYWLAGQREDAKHEFSEAVELVRAQGPPVETRFVVRAISEFAKRAGDQEFLRSILRIGVTEVPEDLEMWEALANAYDAFPGHSGEEIFLELLDARPDDPQAHISYASWLARNSRADDARAHIARVRADGTDDPVLGEGLVRLELRGGDLAAARATWVEMSEEEPDALATRVAGARIAMAEGRTQDAIDTLNALEETEYNHQLLNLAAWANHRQGNLAAAMNAVNRALLLGPPAETHLRRLRAQISIDRGDWEQALSDYETLSAFGVPLSAHDRARYARTLYHNDRAPQGRAILEELLTTRPPRAAAAAVFAEFEGEAQPERAYDLLTRVHRWKPAELAVLEALTRIDRDRGHPEIAVERISQLVEDRQASPRALQLRAEILAEQNSFEAAESDVLRALEANPSLPDAMELLHFLYRAQGKTSQARRAFEHAEQAGVLNVGARHLLARLYLEDQETELALGTLESVVAESPDRWSARADLAFVLAQNGEDLDRAFELATSAVKDSGEDPRALDALGWVELQSGQADVALLHFESGIRSTGSAWEPMIPTLQYHRGLALRALGRDDAAADAFEQALRHGSFPEAEDARQQLEAARHPETAPSPS